MYNNKFVLSKLWANLVRFFTSQSNIVLEDTKQKEHYYRQKALYNGIVLFASTFDYLKSIDSPTFDIDFELSSEFELGLDDNNLNYLLEGQYISIQLKEDLIAFRNYINTIPDELWSFKELEQNPIWETVRGKANRMLEKLDYENKGYDFSVITIIKG